MRARCSVFIATSLDGLIARDDGSLDWLDAANARLPAGEDCGFSAFFASVDCLVMGRGSFEKVLTFGAWPYGMTPVIVLSRTLASLPLGAPSTVSLSRETPEELVRRLSNAGREHLYVDGGLTVQSFLAAGLVDELTVTTIPVLLGRGKRLFGTLPHDQRFELVSSRSWDFGYVQSTYRAASPLA
jgi:dihydrofolate reductase